MNDYRPFMEDATHRAALEGQRFVVLRPHGPLVGWWERLRARLQEPGASQGLSFPSRPHVTLRGFPAGVKLTDVQAVVHAWAQTVPPLRLEAEAVDVFPSPFRVVIARIRETPPLRAALMDLAARAVGHGLPDFPAGAAPAPDQWTFHMSVAYATALDEATWAKLAARMAGLASGPAGALPTGCLVERAEIAAFDQGREYSGGVYALRGPEGPAASGC